MISSSSSEFWSECEKEKKDVAVSADFESGKEKIYEPNQEAELLAGCPNSYFHDRLQVMLSNLRTGADLQREQELGVVMRKMNKEFNKQVQELLKKQQMDMLVIKQDYDSLKNLLLAKDQEVTRLQGLLIEQEIPLTKQRLFKKISRANLIMTAQESVKTNEFELQVKALKIQLMGMKELVKDYQEQTEKAKRDLKLCEQELQSVKVQAVIDLQAQREQSLKSESGLILKIESLTEQYKSFKEEVKKEMEINSIVIKQQMEISNRLKRELKSAKMVLVTPRLREKYTNKLPRDEILFSPESRLRKNMKKKELTFEYLNSTRASPANYSITEINLQSSSPLVGLLPEISSRFISQ